MVYYFDRHQNRRSKRYKMGYAETFKAVDDPMRRGILEMLKDGRMTAGEISERLDITAGTVSHHLSHLKKAGLVIQSKFKNFIYYELNTGELEEAASWYFQFNLEFGKIPTFNFRKNNDNKNQSTEDK